MALKNTFSNEHATVETDSESRLVQVTWLRHASGAPFREVLEIALRQGRAEGLTRWLYDMRRISFTTVADQRWTAGEYLPAFDHRLQHRLAYVASPENVDLLPEALIADSIRRCPVLAEAVEMQVLLDRETAEYWLSR